MDDSKKTEMKALFQAPPLPRLPRELTSVVIDGHRVLAHDLGSDRLQLLEDCGSTLMRGDVCRRQNPGSPWEPWLRLLK